MNKDVQRFSVRWAPALLLPVILLQAVLSLAAPRSGVVGTGTPSSCTEAALNLALSGGGGIQFNCGASPHTITLTATKIIAASTTIDGGRKITLSGGDAVRLFNVNAGVTLTLNNISIVHGNSPLGGCVNVAGTLYASQSAFRNCSSATSFIFAGSGGAIYSFKGTLTLSDTVLADNSAEAFGGGLFLNNATATLTNVTLTGNSVLVNTADSSKKTGSGGGAAAVNASSLNATDSSFSGNTCDYMGQGGGLYLSASTAVLVNVSADGNQAYGAGSGGGFYAEGSTFSWHGGHANDNIYTYDGGGLKLKETATSITNVRISGNTPSASGGGIYCYLGSLSLSDVTVEGNDSGDGGGIYLYDTPSTLTRVTVSRNRAHRYGGGIHNYRNTLTLEQATVSGNFNDGSAINGNQGYGGGISNDSGSLIAGSSTIDSNISSGTGGGIYNDFSSTVSLTNVTISANRAYTEGGGLYSRESFSSNATTVNLTNVTFKDNRAASGGGVWNGNTAYNFMNVKNTILADGSPNNCAGKAFTSVKYSLSTDLSCPFSGATNLMNLPARLFPLQSNGGLTRTHLPGPLSPAVNGVSGVDFPTSDQRGILRPQGGFADIGAVERQPADPAVAPWLYLPHLVR